MALRTMDSIFPSPNSGNHPTNRIKILFLCTGNSCRSQMAEGWARHLLGDQFDAYSAGIRAHGLNRIAVSVMRGAGIDISGQQSKTINRLKYVDFDYVITVCDGANEACPVFPCKAKVMHHGFDDPPRLAATASTDDEAMAVYTRVRDEIRDFVLSLPDVLRTL